MNTLTSVPPPATVAHSLHHEDSVAVSARRVLPPGMHTENLKPETLEWPVLSCLDVGGLESRLWNSVCRMSRKGITLFPMCTGSSNNLTGEFSSHS